MRLLCLVLLPVFALFVEADTDPPGKQGARSYLPASAGVLTWDGGSLDVSLTPYLRLLEDPHNQLTYQQAQRQIEAGGFGVAENNATNFGFSRSTWWVYFTLRNDSDEFRQLVIRQDYPLIDYLDFWVSKAQGPWLHIATGDRVPFDQRPLATRDFQFPVELAPGVERTILMRFQTQGAMNIGLSAASADRVVSRLTKEYLALGIYYGGFLVLLVYNLLLFTSLREKVFVYYALYVLSYGTYMSVHNGLSFQYLWPGNTWLANQSLVILLALSLLWAIRFAREILSTRQLAPVADRIAFAMELTMWITLLVGPFVSYHVVVPPLSVMTGMICLHLLVLGLIALMRGSKPARYYLTAFSALLLGVLAYMLKTFGVLPHNFFTQNAFQLGSLIEMVLLGLAIGSRMNEVKQQSTVDSLTGLHNRRYFSEQMLVEFQKARRRNQPLSLLVLDIDHFKRFNDAFGHSQGDLALQEVAEVLATSIRKPNMGCRYGGEEFAVILPHTSASAAGVLAERIRAQIEANTEATFGLSVSVGVATMSHQNFVDADALFVAADQALYQAKEQGRNRVVLFLSQAESETMSV